MLPILHPVAQLEVPKSPNPKEKEAGGSSPFPALGPGAHYANEVSPCLLNQETDQTSDGSTVQGDGGLPSIAKPGESLGNPPLTTESEFSMETLHPDDLQTWLGSGEPM